MVCLLQKKRVARRFQGNGSCCVVQAGGRHDPRLNSALLARTTHKLDHGTCSGLHSISPALPLRGTRETFPRRLRMLSSECPINRNFIKRCLGQHPVSLAWNIHADFNRREERGLPVQLCRLVTRRLNSILRT